VLLPKLRAQGIVLAVATITIPNQASITLHEKYGFRACGEWSSTSLVFSG